jgi:LacI family transcriptional regulator
MPTIKDVARECGVSANTVSSVLNNRPGEVSAKTRERILEAIRVLGYRPNASARRMVGKRLNTLGIADRYNDSLGGENSYKIGILEGALHAARDGRWDVLYYSGHPSEEQVDSFPAYLDGRCDGLLCFTGSIDRAEAGVIVNTGLPIVFIGQLDPPQADVAVIDVDNEPGAYLAVKHLADLGHTRIGMFYSRGTAGNPERVAGYRRALAERGITVDETLLYPAIPWVGYGYERGREILALPPEQRPTAVFCFNDGLAFGLIRAAAEMGVRIPEQLSIVGFDDIPAAATTVPPLTTIRQPLWNIGQRAVHILLGIVDGRMPRDHAELVPPEIVVRASTAPPCRLS